MIRLSTKGRYGTHLMLNLARQYLEGTEAVILKDISKEEKISLSNQETLLLQFTAKTTGSSDTLQYLQTFLVGNDGFGYAFTAAFAPRSSNETKKRVKTMILSLKMK